jgi:hypothetical protein
MFCEKCYVVLSTITKSVEIQRAVTLVNNIGHTQSCKHYHSII